MRNSREFCFLTLVVFLMIACLAGGQLTYASDMASQDETAGQSTFGRNPVQKFARGLFYIASSIFLVPKEIVQVGGDTEPFYMCSLKGPLVGGAQGAYEMLRQIGAGVFDILTFPSPAGRDWKPLFEPETLYPQL